MTTLDHRVACLIHYLAAHKEPQMITGHQMLIDAMPAAIEHGLAQNPPEEMRVALDRFWLELTPKGRELAMELRTTLETLA